MKEVLMNFLSIFLQYFMAFALPALASAAFAWLFSLAKKAWLDFKAKRAGSASVLEEVAKLAVLAAEQANIAGMIEDKKEYALDIAEKRLSEYGLKVDLDMISAAIEAAVMEQFNKGIKKP
jgi:hypothetical protein